MFATKQAMEAHSAEIQARIEKFSHPSVLTILGYQESVEKNLCSEMNKFSLYSEYLSRTLEKEIQTRSSTQEYFTEEEVMYLVNSIMNASLYLQQQEISYEAIHPRNILVADDGTVKLYDSQVVGTEYISNQNTYLAPEELAFLASGEAESNVDIKKASLYHAGLCMLEIMTLRDVASLVIDRENKKININGIGELVFQAKKSYSNGAVEMCLRLLTEQPDMRIQIQNAFSAVSSYVAPVERPILSNNFMRSVSVIPQDLVKSEVIVEPVVEKKLSAEPVVETKLSAEPVLENKLSAEPVLENKQSAHAEEIQA